MSGTGAEVPLLLWTVMAAEPAVAIKARLTVASNWVPFTNFVGSGAPIHWTTVPGSKPEPFTASVNSPPPATRSQDSGGRWQACSIAPSE